MFGSVLSFSRGIYDNTLIIFTSDNGGPINNPKCSMCTDYAGALNYPFRGGKHTLYEGGVHVNGVLAGELVKNNAGYVVPLFPTV